MAGPWPQVRTKEEQPLSISIKKLGVLAVMAALLVVLAALRPTADTPVAQADLAAPGGIAALPSSLPAMPGVMNQQMPAIIGTGEAAIVAVFCWGPDFVVDCPDIDGSGSGAIALEITRLYPSGGPAATFAATGTSEWTVGDNSGGDMDSMLGVVAVEVDSAAATTGATQGVNEIVRVTATDETGDVRSVNIVIVDTILAWGPTGQVSTASQEQPVFVSYACDRYGRAPLSTIPSFAEAVLGDGDGSQGLDDMYDGLYPWNLMGNGWGSNTLAGDADFIDVWCGGDTAGGLFDDFVDFQTDKGLFGIDPIAVASTEGSATADLLGIFWPPILDFDCGEGKTIDTYDIDALLSWAAWFFDGEAEGGCDLDGWRNGVVTTELLGNGEVGVATITAQQGGGVSPVRTINVTFTGEAALSLFITAPELVGLTGADFTVTIVDQDGRPVGDESVQCTVDPVGGALALLNQTGTTGSTDGMVTFTLIPTGASVVGGEELTITCVMDRDRSISASETINLSSTPDLESVALVEGCNPLAATWADGTAIATVAGAVAPAEALDAIWKFDPVTGTWMGYSPTAPAAVSDLASVDRLDAIFVCVNAAATISRPVI
jgi:hypothetical protein